MGLSPIFPHPTTFGRRLLAEPPFFTDQSPHRSRGGQNLSIRNRFGGNALIPACEQGHVETVELLLKTPIQVDHVNRLGWTCLLEVVLLGDGGKRHQEVARMVLSAGADPNLADGQGVTPLAHAIARGQTEIAAIIRAAGGRMK
jgi:uncharacterized protein